MHQRQRFFKGISIHFKTTVEIMKMQVKSGFSIYVRAIAFVMLIAMFHYVAGYRLMYSLGILYSKEEAKECMAEKNSNIQKLTLSTSEYKSLQWSEENKEFSLNNEMYDVKSIQKSGDTYIITVYTDDKETDWVTSFHTFEKELFHPDQSAKGTKSAEDVLSSFQKDFTPQTELKIHNVAFTRLFQPIVAVYQHPLQVTHTIWHPPVNC